MMKVLYADLIRMSHLKPAPLQIMSGSVELAFSYRTQNFRVRRKLADEVHARCSDVKEATM